MTGCSGEHFYIRSPNRIIQNTAHAQSVDYLRVGRSKFRHVILITRIPWVHIRVHQATRSHRGQVPERTPDCPEPKTFNTFSHKKHIAIPMTREEIRDWHGLKDLALSWCAVLWRGRGLCVETANNHLPCFALCRKTTPPNKQQAAKPYKTARNWAQVTQQQQAQIYVSIIYFYIYAYISTF